MDHGSKERMRMPGVDTRIATSAVLATCDAFDMLRIAHDIAIEQGDARAIEPIARAIAALAATIDELSGEGSLAPEQFRHRGLE